MGCRRSLSGLGLAAFGVYALVAAVLGDNYRYTEGGADYLSPFYSPDLAGWGLDVPFSSAFLVLWVPLGFRATCYYYRKAYYRAFFLSPPGLRRAPAAPGALPRRGGVPVRAHERPPLLPLLRHDRARVPLVRRRPRVLLRRLVRRRASARWCCSPTRSCCRCSRSAATRSATWSAAGSTASRARARARARHKLWRGVGVLNGRHMRVGMDQPGLGRARRPLRAPRRGRRLRRPEDHLSAWSATTTTWS